jgi:hypothetical protein
MKLLFKMCSNLFKLVRWAPGVVRRQRFVNRICPCDTEQIRTWRDNSFGKEVTIQ